MTLTAIPRYRHREDDRVSPVVHYKGTNPHDLEPLAEATDATLVHTGAHSFRFWCDSFQGQRIIHPEMWVFIDENGELDALYPQDFHEQWRPEGQAGAVISESDPVSADDRGNATTVEFMAKPTRSGHAFDAPDPFADDDGIREMSQAEFIEAKEAKEAELRNRRETEGIQSEDFSSGAQGWAIDGDSRIKGFETDSLDRTDDTPDRTDWTKTKWLDHRVAQGYKRNQIAKLSKPILASLPDTPPE